MGISLLFTSGKGGTGKTTLTQCVARALCRRKMNVLVLELDSGLRGLDLMLDVSDRVVFDLSDVLGGRCKPAMAVVPVDVPLGNLHLIAAALDASYVLQQDRFRQFIRRALDFYDFVLMDGSAGLGRSNEIAGSVCSGALIISACDPITVRDGARVADSLRGIPRRLVINRFSRHQLSGELPDIDTVIDRVGVQLISMIPDDPAVPYYCSRGLPLPAHSPAAQEIGDLTRRLLGESVPLIERRLI
jgi:septum site-determining protein MinD